MLQVTKRLTDHSSGATGILKAAGFTTGAARAVADSSLTVSPAPQSTLAISDDTQTAEQAPGMAEPRPRRSTADAAAGAAVTTARWTAQLQPLPEQWCCASALLTAPSEQQNDASVGRATPGEVSRTACSQPPAGQHNGTKAQHEQRAGGEECEGDESAAGTICEQCLGLLVEEADSPTSSYQQRLEVLECIAAKYRGLVDSQQAATASGSTETASATAAEGAALTTLDSPPNQSPNPPEIHDSIRGPAEQVMWPRCPP